MGLTAGRIRTFWSKPGAIVHAEDVPNTTKALLGIGYQLPRFGGVGWDNSYAIMQSRIDGRAESIYGYYSDHIFRHKDGEIDYTRGPNGFFLDGHAAK